MRAKIIIKKKIHDPKAVDGVPMKRFFLIFYGLIIFAVTIGFIIFGEHPRDPRFYITMLVFALIGKVVGGCIDRHE